MPYTPMLPFINGEILSAYKLNSLSRNVQYLNGLFGGATVPFGSVITKGDITDGVGYVYYVRHKYRYFYYDIQIFNYDTLDHAYIYYDGDTLVYEPDDTNPLTGIVDLEDTGILATTPTVGEWYPITFNIDVVGGTPGVDKIHIVKLYETDVTSFTPGSSGASYSSPKIWSHGDYPTAAEMNKYSDSLNFLYDRIGGGNYNPCVFHNRTLQTDNINSANESGLFLFHKYRYLHYLNSTTGAEISDPSGIGDDVSLDDSGVWTTYDLSDIDWMTPGKKYYVKFVTACAEDYTP